MFKPSYETRNKVRIGEKKQTGNGGSRPASVDYFLSDDPEFQRICGDKPKTIRVRFLFPSMEDNFSTGMEWWVKGKSQKNVLACYTKDAEVALRMDGMVNPDDTRLPGENTAGGRARIECRFRECPIFKRGDCKPMGRLVFQLDGTADPTTVLEIDTKSWNTIEALTGFFNAIGDPRGRIFELSVAFQTKGANRFPVLSLKEADVKINTPADVAKADALLDLDRAVQAYEKDQAFGGDVRRYLAAALDIIAPGWRENEAILAKMRENGVIQTSKSLLEKQL